MNSTYKKKIVEAIVFILGLLFVIILYQLFAWHQQSTAYNKETMKLLVPNADKIFKSLFKSLGKSKTYISSFNTLWHLALSILIGGVIGISLGILAGIKRGARIFLKPIMSVFRSSPVVILIIIGILAINRDYFVPIVITSLVVMPIFYQAVVEGITSIDKEQIEAYRMYSNFNLRVIRSIYIPAIWHYLSQALVTAISFGIKVIISTEYLASTNNTIGYLIAGARGKLMYSYLYGYLIIILAIILFLEFIPKMFILKNKNNN